MEKKRLLNYTYGALIGSMVTILWLPIQTALGIFIASVLAHVFMEVLDTNSTPAPPSKSEGSE